MLKTRKVAILLTTWLATRRGLSRMLTLRKEATHSTEILRWAFKCANVNP